MWHLGYLEKAIREVYFEILIFPSIHIAISDLASFHDLLPMISVDVEMMVVCSKLNIIWAP